MSNAKKQAEKLGTELRFYGNQTFRAVEQDGEKIIEGHPAVFNRATDIGGWFQEIIERGAFDGADMKDVPLFVNHDDDDIPLARSRNNNGNSTMTLSIDDTGLFIRAKLDVENNKDAASLYSAVSRGDVDGMSFAFRVKEQTWEGLDTDYPVRRITKFSKIFEVSAVTYPAYADTDIYARSNGQPLESGEQVLESARKKISLESEKRKSLESEIEVLKIKNRILGGI